MSAQRSAAVLSARVACKRFDEVAQSIEANRWPKMIQTIGAVLDTVEGILSEPEAPPVE